jgi:hypothetical protein
VDRVGRVVVLCSHFPATWQVAKGLVTLRRREAVCVRLQPRVADQPLVG